MSGSTTSSKSAGDSNVRRVSTWRQMGNLLWLQWKLTLSTFRSRRMRHRTALVRLLLTAIQVLISLPLVVGFGIGLAIALAVVSPGAAFEITLLVNTFLAIIWLVAPSAYSSQILERFEMARLASYPVSFRSMVLGSTLMGMLTMTGIWTLPLVLGEIVGLAYHAPLAAILIAAGAVPTYLLLVLAGRVMEDAFDLVMSDRRLRALMLFLISIPFMLLGFGQLALRLATDDFSRLPSFLVPLVPEGLAEASTFSEVVEILRFSRWLLWLPPGWVTAAMAYPAVGAWKRGLLYLALGVVTVGAMLALHAAITRRLMQGAALSIGTTTVRSRRSDLRLLARLPALQALFAKDLRQLQRNPMARRALIGVLLAGVMVMLSLARVPLDELGPNFTAYAPIVLGLAMLALVSMALNIAHAANYFGVTDQAGFGTLMTSPVDRRWVILSANLATLLLAVMAHIFSLGVVAFALRTTRGLALLFYSALCMQISSMPVFTLVAILFPYRVRPELQQRRGGNLWGLLAWGVALLPVMLMIFVPYFLWRPAVVVTLPLSAVYTVGIYVATLKPLAALLQRREHVIFESITSD